MRDETQGLLGPTSGWAEERGREGARKMTSLTCSFEEGVQPPRREDRYTERGVASRAPHSTATTKATRHHHLPARTTTSVASPSSAAATDRARGERASELAIFWAISPLSRSLLPSFLSSSAPVLALRTSVTKPFPIFVHRRGLRPRCDGNADAARSCMPRGRRRRGEAEDQPGSITE